MGRQIERHPDQAPAVDGLFALTEAELKGAGEAFISALRNSPRNQIIPGAAFRLKTLSTKTEHQFAALSLLTEFSKDTTTPLGRAAVKALK